MKVAYEFQQIAFSLSTSGSAFAEAPIMLLRPFHPFAKVSVSVAARRSVQGCDSVRNVLG